MQPGETYVFTIPERDRKGWEAHKKTDNVADPTKALLTFVHLSFGDGTGFATSGAKPYPFREHQSSSAPFCRAGPASLVTPGGAVNERPSPTTLRNWFLPMTARSSGGHFSAFNGDYSFLKSSEVAVDNCCGPDCSFLKPKMDSCACGTSPGTSSVACTNSLGTCGVEEDISRWCDEFGVDCPSSRVGVCAPPPPSPSPTAPSSPTPPPTPTPEPTCDPATRPNNSNCDCYHGPNGGQPFWSCGTGCSSLTGANYRNPDYQNNQGCPPDMYNSGNDCCSCIVTTCLDGQSANPFTCKCPSPSPTPTSAGGGVEPSPSPAEIYQRECIDYYWVHFVSYDGGQTWHYADNESYAGCFYEY
jgi:hypothetical protein